MGDSVVHITIVEGGQSLCGRHQYDMACSHGALWAVKEAKVKVCSECEKKLSELKGEAEKKWCPTCSHQDTDDCAICIMTKVTLITPSQYDPNIKLICDKCKTLSPRCQYCCKTIEFGEKYECIDSEHVCPTCLDKQKEHKLVK